MREEEELARAMKRGEIDPVFLLHNGRMWVPAWNEESLLAKIKYEE
jgi:hypothetical protein